MWLSSCGTNRYTQYIFISFNRWVLYGDDHKDEKGTSKGKSNEEFVLHRALHAAEVDHHDLSTRPEPAHKFAVLVYSPHEIISLIYQAPQVTLEPSSYTAEKFALYQVYQKEIHKEEKEKLPHSFKRFLVESPLHVS